MLGSLQGDDEIEHSAQIKFCRQVVTHEPVALGSSDVHAERVLETERLQPFSLTTSNVEHRLGRSKSFTSGATTEAESAVVWWCSAKNAGV